MMRLVSHEVVLYDGMDQAAMRGPFTVAVEGISMSIGESTARPFNASSFPGLSEPEFDELARTLKFARTALGGFRAHGGQGLTPCCWRVDDLVFVGSSGEWQPGRYVAELHCICYP